MAISILEKDRIAKRRLKNADVEVEEIDGRAAVQLHTNLGILSVEVIHKLEKVFTMVPQSKDIILIPGP